MLWRKLDMSRGRALASADSAGSANSWPWTANSWWYSMEASPSAKSAATAKIHTPPPPPPPLHGYRHQPHRQAFIAICVASMMKIIAIVHAFASLVQCCWMYAVYDDRWMLAMIFRAA